MSEFHFIYSCTLGMLNRKTRKEDTYTISHATGRKALPAGRSRIRGVICGYGCGMHSGSDEESKEKCESHCGDVLGLWLVLFWQGKEIIEAGESEESE
jgi:hypothetical protein